MTRLSTIATIIPGWSGFLTINTRLLADFILTIPLLFLNVFLFFQN